MHLLHNNLMQLKPSDIVQMSEQNRVFYEGSYMYLCKNKNKNARLLKIKLLQ